MELEIPLGLTWGENRNREQGQAHIEWHAPCGCAFHPEPFPHVHPCTNEHKRPDLHIANPGVEDCLKELRQMLPLGAIAIRSSITESGTTHIVIYSAYLPLVPYGPTLSEAMSQARKFSKESQK